MPTVEDAFKIARSLMNDDTGLTWGDALLMPKFVQAHEELLAKYQLNGLPTVYEETLPLVVVKDTVSLSGASLLPADFQRPIKLAEYGINETIDNAVPMSQVDFIPNVQKNNTLRYWSWQRQDILLLGASTNRNVLLYYVSMLTTPTKQSDTLPIIQSAIFLGPRIAAIAFESLGDLKRAGSANATAEANLSTLVRGMVKARQGLPVRKQAFSHAMRRRNRYFI